MGTGYLKVEVQTFNADPGFLFTRKYSGEPGPASSAGTIDIRVKA